MHRVEAIFRLARFQFLEQPPLHNSQFTTNEELRRQLVASDAGMARLVEDLVERGLYERTIVAVLGDFGRTPKVKGA